MRPLSVLCFHSNAVIAMSSTLVSAKLGSELWKALRALERVIPFVPLDQQARVQAQLRFARSRLDSLLEEAGLKLTNFEGRQFEPNLPVTAVNAEEIEPSDGLTITQTLEPSVVADGQVLIVGKVIVGTPQS